MSKVPTRTRTETVTRPGAELLIAGGGSELFRLLARTQALHTNLCLNPRHGASLAQVTDLWPDTAGLEAHFKPVDEGQSALWVHDSLSCLASPDKAGRIGESEAAFPFSHSASFFSLISYSLAGFLLPVSLTQTLNVLLSVTGQVFLFFLF